MGLVVSTMWGNNWFWMSCGSNRGFKVRKEIRIFFPPGQNLASVFSRSSRRGSGQRRAERCAVLHRFCFDLQKGCFGVIGLASPNHVLFQPGTFFCDFSPFWRGGWQTTGLAFITAGLCRCGCAVFDCKAAGLADSSGDPHHVHPIMGSRADQEGLEPFTSKFVQIPEEQQDALVFQGFGREGWWLVFEEARASSCCSEIVRHVGRMPKQ